MAQAKITEAFLVPFCPLLVHVLQQPHWCDLCQHIEGVAHRLADAFQPAERADGRQYMRRIGALLASCLDPATLTEKLQQLIEQAAFGSMSEQAPPKFGEHREIKARIGQLQT
jgi:hypothetical protein